MTREGWLGASTRIPRLFCERDAYPTLPSRGEDTGMWGSWVFGVRFAEGGEEGEIIKQVKSRFFHVQKK